MSTNDLETTSSYYEQLSINQKRAVEGKAVALLRKGSDGTDLLALREKLARSSDLDELVRIYQLDEEKNYQDSLLYATQSIDAKEIGLVPPNSPLFSLAPVIPMQNNGYQSC
ncbi:MAG: hypothetical protein DCF25_09750 [Leptolyngbya foveolarum]|uniref:Uncharacterized protein n=1 Tax=Leptolyngbya foveolarum TaxID=47253 RepID=A0A2W4UN29_9CYAN|nr:MAG: hypothetical protein DCF25_09750 [Leptolyngbya foveolarum]